MGRQVAEAPGLAENHFSIIPYIIFWYRPDIKLAGYPAWVLRRIKRSDINIRNDHTNIHITRSGLKEEKNRLIYFPFYKDKLKTEKEENIFFKISLSPNTY